MTCVNIRHSRISNENSITQPYISVGDIGQVVIQARPLLRPSGSAISVPDRVLARHFALVHMLSSFRTRGVVVVELWLALSITAIAPLDRVSHTLAQDFPANLKKTYAAIAHQTDVPLTTLYHRDHDRRSREEHARNQQYLTQEKGLQHRA